jgi:membrane protease YdiL (CAAX protease family)
MIYHVVLDDQNQSDPWQVPSAIDGDGPAPAYPTEALNDPRIPSAPPPRRRTLRVVIAWNVIALCTIALMFLQAWASKLPPPPPSDTSPGLDMVLMGRMALGFEQVFGQSDNQWLMSLEAQSAQSPFINTNRMRVAVVAGELYGRSEAHERLAQLSVNDLSLDIETPSDFVDDQRLFLKIYGGRGYVPTNTEAQQLADRHGWFGELAAGYNLPKNNAQHQAPRSAASRIVFLLIGFGVVVILAGIAGFGLMITGIVMAAMEKIGPRFEPGPLSHNAAYLEMVAIFLVAFIALQLLAALLTPVLGIDLMLPTLLLLVVPLIWPLLCGISVGQFRQDMGLNAPRGVVREVGAGVIGYLAGLPIIFIGGVLTFVVALITGMESDHPASREILTGGTYEIAVLVLATIVWAPLVEEMVFRAAFYRHMRQIPGWGTWLFATIVTSFIFAAIHPQGIVGIPILMSIAFVLAGLRQWRGSLTAPITAHALHNGTIITLTIMLLYT